MTHLYTYKTLSISLPGVADWRHMAPYSGHPPIHFHSLFLSNLQPPYILG